jgi:hypothetical protein
LFQRQHPLLPFKLEIEGIEVFSKTLYRSVTIFMLLLLPVLSPIPGLHRSLAAHAFNECELPSGSLELIDCIKISIERQFRRSHPDRLLFVKRSFNRFDNALFRREVSLSRQFRSETPVCSGHRLSNGLMAPLLI